MADLELGLSVEGVEEATRELAKVKSAQDAVSTSATRSNREVTASARGAADSLRGAAEQGRAFSQAIGGAAGRVQGAAAAFGSLANAIGGSGAGQGLSLVASMAGAVAQGAQLGAQFGPQGALVGGIVGAAIPAFTSMVRWLDRTEQAARDLAAANLTAAESYETILTRMQAVDRQRRQDQRLSMGLGSQIEQDASLAAAESERDAIQSRMDQIDAQLRAGVDTQESRTLDAAYRVLAGELARTRREVESARQGLALLAGDEAAGAEDLLGSLAADAQEEERRRAEAERRARARAAGHRERPPSLTDLMDRASSSGSFSGLASGDLVPEGITGDPTAEREYAAALEETKAAQDAARDSAKEMAEVQAELAEAAKSAQTAFGEGYVNSLDEVIEKWRDANEASRRAGMGMISTARLMERSLVAVGNNIAETIGGTMQGAFTDALGAWLDGSKSFVEAAEDMAKGVIKALTIESIVQAVTEVARAVASFASQDYAGGVAHLAAAAAWGAVGVVAGGVGAAVGAFGGGGADKSAGGGADNRDLSSRAVQERETQVVNVINLYPQWATQREVDTFIINGANSAARSGHQLDPRLLRGAGR